MTTLRQGEYIEAWSKALKKKVFQSSIKSFLIFSIILYVLYAFGCFYGIGIIFTKLPKTDPFRIPYLIAMIASGACLLLATLSLMLMNRNKIVTFTPQSIEYKHGKREFCVIWRELIFKPPHHEGGLYKSALLSDGKIFGAIDNLFFQEFDTIIKVIEMAKDIKSTGTIDLNP